LSTTTELKGLSAPPQVIEALEGLTAELIEAAAQNLVGLALFGGLARGSFHPGFSDVNLVVVLNDASAEALMAIGPALRKAFRAARVEPMIVTAADVPRLAEAFPTKLLDICEHHLMLYGQDVFGAIDVPRHLVRLRIAQELRNLLLRLRRRAIALANDAAALTTALAGVARPLAIELDALLRTAGKPRPADDHTASIFEAAAKSFGLDAQALGRLASLRRDQNPPADVAALLGQVLEVLARAADMTDKLEVRGS
jgi:hypothetical protein